MKKIIALVLAVIMCLSLCACEISKECIKCGREEFNGNKSHNGEYYCYSCYNQIPSLDMHCCESCGDWTNNMNTLVSYKCVRCIEEHESLVRSALAK